MKNFLKLPVTVDTAALSMALQLQPELWNEHAGRREYERSPHKDTADIWVRYNALEDLGTDYKEWTKQHDSSWHATAAKLPQIKPIALDLMRHCEGTRLGGILITKIPAGKSVTPHADRGWHPQYYNTKLYIPLSANPKCVNRVEDEKVVMEVGDVWYFDNTKVHEVVNGGDTERVTLIVCFRVEK